MASSCDHSNGFWGNFRLNRVTRYIVPGTYHVSMFKLNMVISIFHCITTRFIYPCINETSVQFQQEDASAFLCTVLYEHLYTIYTQNFLMLSCHLITSSHYNINYSKGRCVLLYFKLMY
jgi:hypothetical protein